MSKLNKVITQHKLVLPQRARKCYLYQVKVKCTEEKWFRYHKVPLFYKNNKIWGCGSTWRKLRPSTSLTIKVAD